LKSWNRIVIVALVFLGLGDRCGATSWDVYVGTYTNGSSEGIYHIQFDDESGEAKLVGLAGTATNPSFLAFHPREPVLYACARTPEGDAALAFRVDSTTGALTALGQQPAGGKGPCHVAVSPDGAVVAIANYGDGTLTVYPTAPDGGLLPASAFFQHEGSGPNEKRQTGPHAHSVNFDASGKFLVVADLGIDKLMVYKREGNAVVLNDPPFGAAPAGGGPRHFAFHPTIPAAYGVNEMGNTVTLYAWDAETGALEAQQTVPTLPEDFDGENTTADIEVHPSGRFVYASNRGHDSIAMFRVDAKSGELTPRGQTKTGGARPRNFTQDPTGKYLLAANQDTNDIFVFRIDQDTGALTPTGQRIEVGSPVCLVFRRQ